MSKLTKGTDVVVVDGNELKKGNVRDVYEVVGIAIVDLGEGVYKKVPIEQIAIIPETERQAKPKSKSEITITPDEFMDITSKVIAKESEDFDEPMKFMGACAILLGKIHKALFLEDPEND